jgi:hypothetical protein
VKRKGGKASLEELIERVYPSKDGLLEVRAHRAFARAVPVALKRRAMPARLHRGVLHVNAESAAWAQELQMMAPRVLEAMRRADPSLDVRELRFRVGAVHSLEERAELVEPRRASEPVELTPTLAAAISSIRDEGVRDAVLGAVLAYGEDSAPSGRERE